MYSLSTLQYFIWEKTDLDADRSFDWSKLEDYDIEYALGWDKDHKPFTRCYSHDEKVWFDLYITSDGYEIKEVK